MAVALLVAAGSGERLGAGRPKAFVVLAGRTMLEWSLDALRGAGIHDIVVAVPPGEAIDLQDRAGTAPPGEVVDLQDRAVTVPAGEVIDLGQRVIAVAGGATRSASVRAALAAAPPGDVVVHDAARPLVTPAHFSDALAALYSADCAIAAAPVTDTIKEAGPDGRVVATLDRSRLWAVQTPQAFRRPVLERALAVGDDLLARATDDAWLVERAGGTVRVVESTPANFKVTTAHDLRVAELLLADRLSRPSAT
jgi:2-C-methyl-D-erythritol 4-phosphate cytidylyltransferase